MMLSAGSFPSRWAFLAVALIAPACAGPSHDDASVLLITLDTTRADFLGAYGAEGVQTPNLDALAGDGVRFERAVTSVPLTLPAHSSIMTGSWPVDHGVHDNGGFFLDESQVTLAEVLLEHGFATFGIVGSIILHRGWGIGQGMQTFDDDFNVADASIVDRLRPQRDAGTVVAGAIDWWEAHPEGRSFVWMHFYDPHYPYEPPEEFAERYRDRPYAGEIAYTDSQIGEALDYLRRHDRLDSTLIVVVADHGEGLGDHGEPDHGIFLYDPTMRVPLIMRFPDREHRGVVDALVRQIDVMPTVLDYLGLPVPDAVRGESLLGLIEGGASDDSRLAYGETLYPRYHYGWSELRSIRDRTFKLIDAPRSELYNLIEDPQETFNVINLHPDVAGTLQAELDGLLEEDGQSEQTPRPENMDPETLERLRSLGYVGSVVKLTTDDLPDPKDRTAALKLFSRVAYQVPMLLQEGRYEEAVSRIDEALAAEPNYLDGYVLKGEALRKLGRYDEAIVALEKGLQLNPDAQEVRVKLALCYLDRQDLPVALGLLQQVHAQSPRSIKAAFNLADVLGRLERHDEALRVLEELAEIYPDSAYTRYEIGRAHLKRGDLRAARGAIERALNMQEELPGAHYNLALIDEAEGDPAAATAGYERELAGFPENYEAWTNLGILRAQSGDPELAAEAFGKVVELQPELSIGYYLLARCYLELRRPRSEVIELAERAAALERDGSRARQLLDALR